jgi:hypothetical protein
MGESQTAGDLEKISQWKHLAAANEIDYHI